MVSIRNRKKKIKKKEQNWRNQRNERGYSDSDVWNLCDWFIRTLKPMLKQLSENHMGFPESINREWFDKHEHELGMSYDRWVCWPSEEKDPEGYAIRSKANDECAEQWKQILSHMVFLLGEMDENTCTQKNPYEADVDKANAEFHAKYGFLGDGLKTEEEKAEEGKKGLYRAYFPTDEPGRDDIAELYDKYYEEEKRLASYRDKCKDEFFKLFSKYFWNLWD